LALPDSVNKADLIVLTPENKLISNLPEQYGRRFPRAALWGHGANLQGNPKSLRERFKRIVARRADWWFGYTDMSVPLIQQTGFPANRITVLNNSVDTTEMTQMRRCSTPDRLNALRRSIGLNGDRIGVFVGSLYSEKRIAFMLDAAVEIRKTLPDFEFLIIGGGPDESVVTRFCAQNSWAHYLGVRKGQDKVDAVALASLMLNPGLVGLGILDSFVCGVPMITTDCGLHSPEIAYLQDGLNGRMTTNTLDAFVKGAVEVLANEAIRDQLRAGCAASAERYTVENMARNFADGVLACLNAPIHRGQH